MAAKRPVLCPNCGAQVRKNGYCSSCYMHIGVLKKAYNTSDYYYNMGYDKAVARDLSGAIESLNASLRYNKKNIMSRNLLGLIYYEMGELVMALSHWVMSVNYQTKDNLASGYLRSLREDPTRLDDVNQIARKFNMALGYAESGDYDLAILQLKAILGANPHFVKGYLLLALLYIEGDNYEKARKTLRRVLKIDKANPLAIHYLHEMGDSDENIIQMRMESIENDGLLEDEMSETAITVDGETQINGRIVKNNIFREIMEKRKENTIKTGELGEVGFAKYSGVYVIVGLVLGILLLFFIISPLQKKKLREENDALIRTYSEELASKNAEISGLEEQMALLNAQIEELQNSQTDAANPLPDYSEVQSGMSDMDIQNMIDDE